MTTINTTRSNTVTQNQTQTQTGNGNQGANYTLADLGSQGLQQGATLARQQANNADFDLSTYVSGYAIPYLQSQGLNNAQVSAYVSAMVSEYNYLTPTGQLDNNNSNVGSDILNQVLPNSAEPNMADSPTATSPQTLVNQGTVLGHQLAAVQNTNSSNFDIAQYTQNVGNAMSRAGWSAAQVDAFQSAVMMGYASALGGYLSQ